jgi:hypothetical protein
VDNHADGHAQRYSDRDRDDDRIHLCHGRGYVHIRDDDDIVAPVFLDLGSCSVPSHDLTRNRKISIVIMIRVLMKI